MTELNMDCLGSVILFQKDAGYCAQCPLQGKCEEKVAQNRVLLEEALRRPVFDADGKFWSGAARMSRQRRAMATYQSSVAAAKAPATTPSTPTPAPKAELDKSAAPLEIRTPFDASRIEGLPKKVGEELTRWVRHGIDPSAITSSVNPFGTPANFKFAYFLCEALLSMKAVPTKNELRVAIDDLMAAKGERPWSLASSQSNVNIVTGAFKACGLNLIKE